MERGRRQQGLARFERIALVLSGCQALGAYQAGVCAALEPGGIRPDWIAGSGIGAVTGAIVAGNPPHRRIAALRRFWQELSRLARRRAGWRRRWWSTFAGMRRLIADPEDLLPASPGQPPVAAAELCELINNAVDFGRLNSGAVRLMLGVRDFRTTAERFFDNDRDVLTADHILAAAPLAGLPPVALGGRRYGGGSAVSVAALDRAPPADTLCFVIDGYDPSPGGTSRAAREIAAMQRTHDLRRMIALLGERLPPAARREADIRRCLAEGREATMTILRLVHDDGAAGLAAKVTDYSPAALTARWRAGESDVLASLAHPRWLAPPPRLAGIVVHEVRGGVVASQR